MRRRIIQAAAPCHPLACYVVAHIFLYLTEWGAWWEVKIGLTGYVHDALFAIYLSAIILSCSGDDGDGQWWQHCEADAILAQPRERPHRERAWSERRP